jgi:hyperosmotically inducible periplasmic protein
VVRAGQPIDFNICGLADYLLLAVSMEHRNYGRILKVAVLLAGTAIFLAAQENPPKPDNSKANQADRGPNAPTPDQQKNNKSDRETTRQIRKALTSDHSLSTYAHNVKVIAQNGTVTLKGPVKSEDEKKAVEAKAAEVAGASNVKNELTVAGDRANSKTDRN